MRFAPSAKLSWHKVQLESCNPVYGSPRQFGTRLQLRPHLTRQFDWPESFFAAEGDSEAMLFDLLPQKPGGAAGHSAVAVGADHLRHCTSWQGRPQVFGS
jgi:hypothetical protein